MGQQYRATKPLDPEAVKAANAAVGGRKLGSRPEDAADRRSGWRPTRAGVVEPSRAEGAGSAVLTREAHSGRELVA
jgi:hypothetical protein